MSTPMALQCFDIQPHGEHSWQLQMSVGRGPWFFCRGVVAPTEHLSGDDPKESS